MTTRQLVRIIRDYAGAAVAALGLMIMSNESEGRILDLLERQWHSN